MVEGRIPLLVPPGSGTEVILLQIRSQQGAGDRLLCSPMLPLRSAEILTIGTELLLGEIDDTNSARLAADLAKRGVDVFWTQRLGDNLERVRYALERAIGRSDLIVLTGGLGPTDDDLTRDAVAAALGETMTVDPGLEEVLRARFRSMGRPMPERNLRQATLIPSAIALANPIGTAPGWLTRVRVPANVDLHLATVETRPPDVPGGSARAVLAGESRGRDLRDHVIVTLPGPPREMIRMWLEEAVPRLGFPQARLHSVTLKILGIGEGAVAERLGSLTDAGNPSVATYAKRDGVHVRVAAKADDADAARSLAEPVAERVRALFGDAIWGEGEDELDAIVVRRLIRERRTIAVAEVCSAGALADALAGVPGADETLRGAVIAYAPETMATFGLPRDLLARLPGAAAEVTTALAAYVRALFGTDLGVAVGPASALPGAVGNGDNGPDELERGGTRVVIAIASNDGTRVEAVTLPPLGQAWLRERLAFTSLALLRSI